MLNFLKMLNSPTQNCINRDTMYKMKFGFFMNVHTF